MAADDPQLKFRVPADLRRRLDEAADQNHRSVSAEVVARLESTFERIVSEPHLPERLDDDGVLYVLLDGNGIPTSWNEIMLHLGNIVRARGIEYRSIEARIVDADVLSGSAREQEWHDLMLAYRDKLAKPEPSSSE